MAEPKKKALVARPYARAVEITCPAADNQAGCDRDDPIPAPDGSFMWERVPAAVVCPTCGGRFRVAKKVSI